MSTTFTMRGAPNLPQQPMGQMLMQAQQWLVVSLLHQMAHRGHNELTPAHLSFLANLDCGETHASAVARRMGVSRQAVYRSTRELQKLGLLRLIDDPEAGNRKIVQMTPRGMKVATDARACLTAVESTLEQRIGARRYAQLQAALSADWGQPIGAPD